MPPSSHATQPPTFGEQATHTTEALVVGAGPCGLFQAFQLGLQGISCCVVDALAQPGGQCTELYPDKPIYDIPGIPCTRADQLITDLDKQLKPFNTTFFLSHQVVAIDKRTDDFLISTNHHTKITARYVILATGAGAFTPVRLRVDGLNTFEGSQIFYDSPADNDLQDRQVLVIGDTPGALMTALKCSRIARQTTLLHRKRRLSADDITLTELARQVTAGTINQLHGKLTDVESETTITAANISLSSRETMRLPLDVILPRLGSSPKLSPLDQWGINTTANHVAVDPAGSTCNVSGLYAIGDINTYAGKRKLILCGFHEATLAAFHIAALQRPDKPVHTLYTTTSTELQKRLGVSLVG